MSITESGLFLMQCCLRARRSPASTSATQLCPLFTEISSDCQNLFICLCCQAKLACEGLVGSVKAFIKQNTQRTNTYNMTALLKKDALQGWCLLLANLNGLLNALHFCVWLLSIFARVEGHLA